MQKRLIAGLLAICFLLSCSASALAAGWDQEKDDAVESFVQSLRMQNAQILNTVVATAEVPLVAYDPDTGKRLVRSGETNLGDLIADAYRAASGADVAVVNGGGIRDDIAEGDITYDDIIEAHPFGNEACVVEATGQQILDLLEAASRYAPDESGGFLQVSGLSYEVHTDIRPSIVVDDQGRFVRVDGQYRVQNVTVGEEPIDLSKTYTLASYQSLIKSGVDGFALFADSVLPRDEVNLDDDVLIKYIAGELGGVIGEAYEDVRGQGRVTVYMNPFKDAQGEWFSDSVSYMYTNGIVSGTTDTTFSPYEPISRAMFITLLHRVAGSPEVTKRSSDLFLDCPDGSWYSDAVVWASKWLPVDTDSLFEPDASLTRQDMAFMLYRYIKSGGGGFSGAWSFIPDYSDIADISYWAYEAVAYCAVTGIMQGSDGRAFLPKSLATRATAVTVLHRFDSMVK